MANFLLLIIQINQTNAYHYENTRITSWEVIVHYSLNRTRRWKQKETRIGDDSNKTVYLRHGCWSSNAAIMWFSTRWATASIILTGSKSPASVGPKSIRIAALRVVAGFAEAKSIAACKLKRKPNVFCQNRSSKE